MRFIKQGIFPINVSFNNLLLMVILLAAAFLRLFQLGSESFWYDEISQLLVAQNPIMKVIPESVKHYANAPLDYVITHLAFYYLGNSEFWLRLAPATWGTLSVFIAFLIGKKAFNIKTGLLSAFFFATLPIHIHYSREVRFYSLATLMALMSVLFFIKAIECNSRKYWIIFGIVQVLAFYSHYYLVFIAAVEGVWLIFNWITKKTSFSILKNFIFASGTAFILFLPWVTYDFQYERTLGQGLSYGNLFKFVFPTRTSLLTMNFFYSPVIFKFSLWWIWFSIGVLIFGLFLAFITRKDSSKFSQSVGLFFLIYISGLIMVVSLDLFTSYIFANRQTVIFNPFFLLVISATLVKITTILQEKVAAINKEAKSSIHWLQNGILMAVAFFSLWSLSTGIHSIYDAEVENWQTQRQDWKGTAAFLNRVLSTRDIVLTPHLQIFSFYSKDPTYKIIMMGNAPWLIEKMAKNYDRVWVLTTSWQLGSYKELNQFIETKKLVDLSLHPGLRLYVYSPNSSPNDLIAKLLRSGAYTPSAFINTDIIKRAIDANLKDETYNAVNSLLNDPNLEEVNKATIAYISGKQFMNARDCSKAMALTEKSLKFDSSKARTWLLLGQIYRCQNKLEESIPAFMKAVSIDSNDYLSYHLMAKSQETLGRWDDVRKSEEKALLVAQSVNSRFESLKQLAFAYEKLGNTDNACKAYSDSLELMNDKKVIEKLTELSCAGEYH